MKALIKKDVLTLGRQFRYFLVLLLFFAAIPGDFASSFAMVYAIKLPVSAIAYDERSKWDTLAAGMPYTPLAIVGGKYALGYLEWPRLDVFRCWRACLRHRCAACKWKEPSRSFLTHYSPSCCWRLCCRSSTATALKKEGLRFTFFSAYSWQRLCSLAGKAASSTACCP